ncbi:MAG: TIGR03619 family F420-dependent LLM class oxidoreductase [Acidimicrobiales bacterium]
MIRLGLNVPNFGPGTTPATLRSWVQFAEETGFSLVMMSDHVAPTPDVTALYPAPFYDPFTTLSWLASYTTRLSLGTSVAIVPYRHPLVTARMSANLDQFTGGRFVLGVGVGWSEPEFGALGVSFPERGRITDEFLAVITRAWTEPSLSFTGDHVQFRDVATGPAPVRHPGPPLWVGGMGEGAIRRAARFGDAWHAVNPGRDWLQNVALPRLADAAASLGKPTPRLSPRIKARFTTHDLTRRDRPLGVGSLSQIGDDLVLLDKLGADTVVLDTNPDHPDQRQPTAGDRRTLRKIVEWTDDRGLLTSGSSRGYQPLHQGA